MSNRIIIVDEEDTPVGLKYRSEVHYEDIYRVTGLWLTDIETGDILLQQRKWNKINNPGKWQCAVAGTVEEGETYEQNIAHEIEEEIGVHGLQLREGGKEYVDDGAHKYFCQQFLASVDKKTIKITIQEEEVESVKWISKDALIADVTHNPGKYAPFMKDSMEILGVFNT